MKQAAFVAAILLGKNATQASRDAGYKGNERTLENAGSRLLSTAIVANAVERGQRQAQIQNGWDRARAVEELEKVATDPSELGSARVSAVLAIGKFNGLIVDRKRVEGEIDHKLHLVPGQGPVGQLTVQELRKALVAGGGTLDDEDVVEGEVVGDDG